MGVDDECLEIMDLGLFVDNPYQRSKWRLKISKAHPTQREEVRANIHSTRDDDT